MSLEIPMHMHQAHFSTQPPAGVEAIDDATMVTSPPPVNAKPMHVLISPILPVPADGASLRLPPAYTGVLYLEHHKRDDEPNNNKNRETWLQEMRGWLILLATLAASVTFQAGLNPPGGFWQANDDQGHVAGMAVLESMFPKRYTLFFYFNATAFVTSVVIIILLMNESFYHSEAKVEALEVIVVLDMAGLMGAYIAGSTREVSSSIYIIVLAVVVFLYIIYTARFLPKLWDVVIKLAWVQKASLEGTVSVPKDVLDRVDAGRTKSAPAAMSTRE